MKRNIEVKEKQLIDKMNETIAYDKACKDTGKRWDTTAGQQRWDNHGPVQFEQVEDNDKVNGPIDTQALPLNEQWKKEYFKDKEVKPMEVSLTPRNDDGSFVEGVEDWDNPLEDNRDSRAPHYASPLPLGKAIEIEYNRLMRRKVYLMALKKALDEIKDDDNKGTHLRTHIDKESQAQYEMVNHPQHYNNYDVEVIDMMEKIFGLYDTYAFCKLNAFKYRMRAGTKPSTPAQQDLDKEQWYLTRAENIKSRMTDADRERATEFSKKIEEL